MRKSAIGAIVSLSVVLAGCVDDTASYRIDGPGSSHGLTVRRQQQYFWKDEVAVTLLASRMPDCQRLHQLDDIPADKVKMDVFSPGDDETFNLRMGGRLWQIETQTCEGLTELQDDPNADVGQPVGTFSVQNDKLVFTPAAAAAAATTATAPQ
jgi:hypothetical protein